MADKDEHPIRTGLIVAIGGAVGVAAVFYVASFIPGLLQKIWHGCKWLWAFLLAGSATPRWLLFALVVLAIPTLWRLGKRCIPTVREPKEKGPEPLDWRDYRQDTFLGAVWRWGYGANGTINNPWCFCPRCDTQLVYQDGPYRGISTIFVCDHCKQVVFQEPGEKDQAVARVVRQIDRKLRNDEWKQVVATLRRNQQQLQ